MGNRSGRRVRIVCKGYKNHVTTLDAPVLGLLRAWIKTDIPLSKFKDDVLFHFAHCTYELAKLIPLTGTYQGRSEF